MTPLSVITPEVDAWLATHSEITDDLQHAEAMSFLERLITRDPPEGSYEGYVLETLSLLIERYESVRWPL